MGRPCDNEEIAADHDITVRWNNPISANATKFHNRRNQIPLNKRGDSITIDSALAHLAGALAAPTWLLLRQLADWRWQMNGERTPWYPSLTVLRQPVLDDWRSLQAIVVARLQSLLDSVV